MKMILAVDIDNAIGWADGKLPWKSRTDMAMFKKLTSKSLASGEQPTVVMGRKTFDSIGKSLPNRTNYVLTRDQSKLPQSPLFISSLSQLPSINEAWLIGGATLYDSALTAGIIHELYVTCVHLRTHADVRLNQDVYDWVAFIKHESSLGRAWGLTEHVTPDVEPGEPKITFNKLVRIQ